MKRELDMTGCIKVHRDGEVHSICENCAYPLGKCTWLLGGKPFPGTEYVEKKAVYYGEVVYSTYSIMKCPHYEGEA